MKMDDRHFSNFSLAGFTYYEGIDVFQELNVGSYLIMKAEPENKYDPCAVALYYRNKKLGFVPREENPMIFKFLQLGYADLFEVRINRISPESHPEKQIGVVVRITGKKPE
jgi:hypothetical protein